MKEKMWLIPVGVALAMVLGACSALQCRAKDKVSTELANRTAEVLECDGKAAIKEDFESIAEAVGICRETQETGPIGEALCKPVIDGVLFQLKQHGIPAKWKCRASAVTATLSAKLTERCIAIVPVKK